MTYPPGQPPFPGPDPSQPGTSPYGAPGVSPYAPPGAAGASPYGAPPAGPSPYGPPTNPYDPSGGVQPNPYGPPNPYGAPGNPYGAPGNPYGVAGPGGLPPSNNIGWAIAAIFLFWPLAIPAFIASGKVDELWRIGDFAGAQHASADAKKWGSLGVWIGVGFYVLACCLFVLLPLVFGVGLIGAAGVAGSG